MTNVRMPLLWAVIVLGTACFSGSQIAGPDAALTDARAAETSPDAESGKVVTMAFAADFARGTGCRAATVDTLNKGCDIYVTTLDITTGAVSNVKRMTTADEPEGFPAIGKDGSIYYNVYSGTATRIGYAIGGETGQLLANANHLSIAEDGTKVVYGDTNGHKLVMAELSANGKALVNSKPLTGEAMQFEPEIAGDYVIFYQEFPDAMTKNAQGRLYNLVSALTVDFTDQDGSAHCTLSPKGTLGTCNNATRGGVRGRNITDGTLGDMKTIIDLKSPTEMAKIDPAYADCTSIAFNFPTFCGDDTHIVLGAVCAKGTGGEHGSNGVLSKLFLVNLEGSEPRFTNLGDALATQAGGIGKDSMTAGCTKKN